MVNLATALTLGLVARLCCASRRSREMVQGENTNLLLLLLLSRTLSASLLLRLALLQEGLRNEDIVLSGDGPACSD